MPSKVNISAEFDQFVSALQNWSKESADAYRAGDQVKWFRPDGVSALDDYDALLKPFDRAQVNQECVSALADPVSPGVSGDIVAGCHQIEYLSVAGRAFLNRHAGGPIRAAAHLNGRRMGHGLPTGPLALNVRDFAVRVLAGAKQP